MAEIFDFGMQQHKIKMDSWYFENVLSVVAGDTGRRIEVQLLDTNGMVQNTTGLNLRLNAVIAGKATFTDATLVDAATGKYQLDLSNGMFLAPGNWQFQWQITDAAGKKLHSFAFTGNVGSNLSEGGTEATNFYLNADELKQMQDDLVNGTFDSEVLETNIAEKLTDLETQYAPKLTEVNAQLTKIGTEGVKVGEGTSYGYFSVLRLRNILDYHAFEDLGQLKPITVGQGYASFDAKAVMETTVNQGHFAGYQARQIFKGTGNLTGYLHGYDTDMVHSGSGEIKEVAGMYIKDISVPNGGSVVNDYGIYIADIKKGINHNYGIYSKASDNYFEGLSATRYGFPSDVVGKAMTVGFGGANANPGVINFYDGRNALVCSISGSGLKLEKPIKPKKYTTANLIVGEEGDIAYCTNGRKTGEPSGGGTGVPVYYSNGGWRRYSDDSFVTA